MIPVWSEDLIVQFDLGIGKEEYSGLQTLLNTCLSPHSRFSTAMFQEDDLILSSGESMQTIFEYTCVAQVIMHFKNIPIISLARLEIRTTHSDVPNAMTGSRRVDCYCGTLYNVGL